MPIDKKKPGTFLDILSDIINHSDDAISIVDPQTGLFTFVNDTACATLGYARNELLKMCITDIDTALPDNSAWQTLVNDIRQRGTVVFEGFQKRKDGTPFPVEGNISYAVLNTREYLVTVTRRTTERKQIEEEEERLAEAASGFSRGTVVTDEMNGVICASDLIQIVSPEGHILYANRSWRETLGYSEGETKALILSDIIDPTCSAHCQATFGKILSEGRVKDIKTIFLAKDGRKVFLEGSGRCIYENGKPGSVRCIFRDVTSRKAEGERTRCEPEQRPQEDKG